MSATAPRPSVVDAPAQPRRRALLLAYYYPPCGGVPVMRWLRFTRNLPSRGWLCDVVTQREEKIERERPPPTPEPPRMAFNASGIDNNVAQLSPIVDARGAMSRLSMSAGSDRDVIPLVRINPDYPPRAQTRGIEGYVIVQFTITATGTVKDAIVVEAQPRGMFDDAALKAIARWRYNPKVDAGVAVERVGVRTRLTFQLEQ